MLEWSLEISRKQVTHLPAPPWVPNRKAPLDYTVTLRRGTQVPERAGQLRVDQPPPGPRKDLDTQVAWARGLNTRLGAVPGWATASQELRAALQRGPARLVVLSHADEVRAWPWEALPLGDQGPGLGLEAPEGHALAVVHRAPGCASRLEAPPGPPRRVLLAWTDAGGWVNLPRHQQALERALPGVELKPLPNASAAAVRMRLEKAREQGTPFDTLHLLCHGDLLGGPMAEGDRSAPNAVDPWVDALRGAAPTLARVVLMACTQGDHAARPWESLAARLHREGLHAVVACRWPVRQDHAERLAEALYTGLATAVAPEPAGYTPAAPARPASAAPAVSAPHTGPGPAAHTRRAEPADAARAPTATPSASGPASPAVPAPADPPATPSASGPASPAVPAPVPTAAERPTATPSAARPAVPAPDEGLAATRARQALASHPDPEDRTRYPADDSQRKLSALGLQVYQHAPVDQHAPDHVPPSPPARRRWVGPAALLAVVLAALAADRLRPAPAPSPRPELPEVIAPAPRATLPLTLVYLDAPQPGEDRAATWAQALEAVLAQGPQALLLGAPHRPPGLDPALLQATLRAHPQATVLGLLPNPEGGPVSADLAPLLPACPAGPAAGCVQRNLPAPTRLPPQVDPTAGPLPAPLRALTRCLGTTPTAALALAALAQRGALPTLADCRMGESYALPTPPADPCAGPYRWLWAAELATGPRDPPRDPWRPRGPAACAGWAGLAGRLVVLSDPWAEPARSVQLGQDPTQIPLTQAEALALAAWATLGVLEDQ